MPHLNHIEFDRLYRAVCIASATFEEMDELAEIMRKAKDNLATAEELAAARDEYASDDIEIDDEGAGASRTDEGTWVQAWVYVAMSDDEPEEEDDQCVPSDDADGAAMCFEGMHSWIGMRGKLAANTACTRCGELYGDPS